MRLPQFMRDHAAIHEAEPGTCAACDEVREERTQEAATS